MGAESMDDSVQFAIIQFSAGAVARSLPGLVGPKIDGAVRGKASLAWNRSRIGMALGNRSLAVFQIQAEPSPTTAQRDASVRPRRLVRNGSTQRVLYPTSFRNGTSARHRRNHRWNLTRIKDAGRRGDDVGCRRLGFPLAGITGTFWDTSYWSDGSFE
jgi:hypothetical protein